MLKDDFIVPVVREGNLSAYAQYCIRSKNREESLARLKEKGIPSAIYYPKPLHLATAYQDLGYREGDLPVTEKVSKDIFALPMHPFLTRDEQDQIIGPLIG